MCLWCSIICLTFEAFCYCCCTEIFLNPMFACVSWMAAATTRAIICTHELRVSRCLTTLTECSTALRRSLATAIQPITFLVPSYDPAQLFFPSYAQEEFQPQQRYRCVNCNGFFFGSLRVCCEGYKSQESPAGFTNTVMSYML